MRRPDLLSVRLPEYRRPVCEMVIKYQVRRPDSLSVRLLEYRRLVREMVI